MTFSEDLNLPGIRKDLLDRLFDAALYVEPYKNVLLYYRTACVLRIKLNNSCYIILPSSSYTTISSSSENSPKF